LFVGASVHDILINFFNVSGIMILLLTAIMVFIVSLIKRRLGEKTVERIDYSEYARIPLSENIYGAYEMVFEVHPPVLIRIVNNTVNLLGILSGLSFVN
jgi:uncharacterized membrane protein